MLRASLSHWNHWEREADRKKKLKADTKKMKATKSMELVGEQARWTKLNKDLEFTGSLGEKYIE